jgi:hypothetical protein
MRTDREEAIRNHPASGVAVADKPDGSIRSPYRAFLDALEELDLVVSLHGTASVEAAMARAEVRRARDLAAQKWRSQLAA